jgi:hypothetical protein
MTSPNAACNDKVRFELHKTATPEGASTGYSVDGYEVHTHPDLVGRLRELIAYVPDAHFQYVFGIATLQTAASKIFAVARGTFSLCLYIDGETIWGRQYEEFGTPWRQGYAWARGRIHTKEDEELLAELVRRAYSSVRDSA